MSSEIIRDLVRKAQKGDADSFGELYEMYADDMYRFAYYYTGSAFNAQDCVSDAALLAFEKINTLKKAEAFKSWIFKILYNRCKVCQKEKAVVLEYNRDGALVEATYTQSDDVNENIALKNALKKLTDEEREIIILHYTCGYTSKEIGKITGLKDATVRSKISRTAAKLRTMLSM